VRWLRNALLEATSRLTRHEWSATRADASPEILAEARTTLERILAENILAFWYPRAIDDENGGYRINHDALGNWQGERRDRQSVSQARTLWFFARLMTSPYRSEQCAAMARHGFEFLRDRLWDHEFGGLFWEIDSTGRTPTKADKHLYAQAFGLYALAEYAIASADPRAESMARELYGLLEGHAHDDANGGYREFFQRDWRPVEMSSPSYLEKRADIKQLNTHLHVLEALTRYHDLVREPAARNRLTELILILSSALVRKRTMAYTDVHAMDWTPSLEPAHAHVTYGHDLETVWLLIEACESTGLPNPALRDFYDAVFYNSWRFGCDHRDGGFFYQGPIGQHATAKQKVWWVQAEALVCALHMYRLTRRQIYLSCFRDTLLWITRRQIDWQVGEWHRRIEPDGTASGDKTGDQTGAWKTPYHSGRAIIRCLDLIAAEQARLQSSRAEPSG
jgi:cellobiose epimerase